MRNITEASLTPSISNFPKKIIFATVIAAWLLVSSPAVFAEVATFDEMKNWGDKLPFNYYFENINADELGLQLSSKIWTYCASPLSTARI